VFLDPIKALSLSEKTARGKCISIATGGCGGEHNGRLMIAPHLCAS